MCVKVFEYLSGTLWVLVFSLLIFCLNIFPPVPCARVRHLEECVSQHSVEHVVSAALAGSTCAALISSKHWRMHY